MKKEISLLFALMIFGMGSAQADTYFFTDSNTIFDTPPASGVYGTLDVDYDSSTGDLTFSLAANTGFFTGDNVAWDKFYFNVSDYLVDVFKSNIDETDVQIYQDITDDKFSISYTKNVSIFGDFVVEFADTGGSKYDPLTVVISLDELNGYGGLTTSDFTIANSEGYIFSAHLKGFDGMDGESDGEKGTYTSTFLGVKNPVPEPGTMLLFGIGLTGLVGFSRSRRS